MKKLYFLLKKYLPDITVITGVGILSYNIWPPTYTNSHTTIGKMLGLILVIIGIDIALRRYILFKKDVLNK